jgi:LysM repeat protein
MRLLLTFLTIMSLLAACGCNASKSAREEAGPRDAIQANPQAAVGAASGSIQARAYSTADQAKTGDSAHLLPVSDTELSKAAAEYAERKVIRNATLTLEVDNPSDVQARLTSVAESHGGFVVTSDFKRTDTANPAAPNVTVTVVLRVPSSQFGAAVAEIHSFAGRVKEEKTTGQDVTEEYIDLEARLRTKKALEAQFLEIMKQAHKISDALEVQSQIAEVRTDIERIEGRRRFLDNQSSLSTITVTLQIPAPPPPLIATTKGGFGESIAQAFGDCVDTGAAIITGVIRIIGVMIPVTLLIILPAGFALKFFVRWLVRYQKKPEPAAQSQ